MVDHLLGIYPQVIKQIGVQTCRATLEINLALSQIIGNSSVSRHSIYYFKKNLESCFHCKNDTGGHQTLFFLIPKLCSAKVEKVAKIHGIILF